MPTGETNAISGRWHGIAEPLRAGAARGLEAGPFVSILQAGNRNQLALVEPDKRCIDHVLRRHDDRWRELLPGEAGDFPQVRRRRARQHRLDADAFIGKLMLADVEQVGNSAKRTADYLDRYLSTALRDAPGKGCTMAALAADIRQESRVKATFTEHVKTIIEKMVSHFVWRSKRSARGDSIRMLSIMVGALILARAVDDEVFSKEILREARRGLV